MKPFFLILSLSLFSLCLSQSSYRCASELKKDKLCSAFRVDGFEAVQYVDGCAEDEECLLSPEDTYCTKIEIKKEEGDKCTEDAECKSGICSEGVCITQKDGEHCERDYECGKFSACNRFTNLCQPLVEEGGECSENSQCGLDLVCSLGKCTKMFSLNFGEQSNEDFACKTGLSKRMNTSEGRNFYCVSTKRLTPTCDEIGELSCEYEVTLKEGEEPQKILYRCLPKWNSNPYCYDDTSLGLWQEFLKTYQEEISKIDPKEIKVTEGRNKFWSVKSYRAYNTAIYNGKLKGAEKCVYDFFEANYKSELMKYFLD